MLGRKMFILRELLDVIIALIVSIALAVYGYVYEDSMALYVFAFFGIVSFLCIFIKYNMVKDMKWYYEYVSEYKEKEKENQEYKDKLRKLD